MHLERLHVTNVRNIVELELLLQPGINVFVGPNGAGKTSLLEAAYLLSHARSFRSGNNESLIRRGCSAAMVAASICKSNGVTRLGLSRSAAGWEARVDHASVPSLGIALREFALVCFEPGSHALVAGSSQERRQFLDWGVFHVEPEFLAVARRYRRILNQRNAALKQAASDAELDVWDSRLVLASEPLNAARQTYFSQFSTHLTQVLLKFLPELGNATARLFAGWSGDSQLGEVLMHNRGRDRMRGHTTRGPHRADWSIQFQHAPMREHLSRGQEKLCALACVLAQAKYFAGAKGEWPVIALDDLSSELDRDHQNAVVDLLTGAGAQVLISGVEMPPSLQRTAADMAVFHVEHGQLRSLL